MKAHITVFEHQSLKLRETYNGIQFSKEILSAFQKHYGAGVPYFSLIHDGIRFNQYVGVIQVGKTVVEVLPKADKANNDSRDIDKDEMGKWRNTLIGMMRAVGSFDIRATSNSSLRIKNNTILDLYFEMFIIEVERLLHQGLIKKYRKTEGNTTALKGSLQFEKNLQQNLIHQERFYVRYTTYDAVHTLHFILYKVIRLLRQINTNVMLHGRIGGLLVHFPDMPDISVSESTFDNLVFNRKTDCYRKAVNIAKMLLMRFHPDLSKGKNDVLALMFDMNKLWEEFVYVSLRKHDAGITKQSSRDFWEPDEGRRSRIRPDLVWRTSQECVVLDTKWKNLDGCNPSSDDLRQMYVYQHYFSAGKVALVYPGSVNTIRHGYYLHPENNAHEGRCSMIPLPVESEIELWQLSIYNSIAQAMGLRFHEV